jgi:hypothetical protein
LISPAIAGEINATVPDCHHSCRQALILVDVVQGTPLLDAEGLVWSLDTRPA